jgi:hypothetical protein
VGVPYFDTPVYAGFGSDPNGRQSSFRIWTDDLNHDGMLDILVEGEIWNSSRGFLKTILQMFQNFWNYKFKDVTDAQFPEYDKDCVAPEDVPQVRDIDGSGINSYLVADFSFDATERACQNVIVNDGAGNLLPALYQTLRTYGQQANAWLTGGGQGWSQVVIPPYTGYAIDTTSAPMIRAYRTPNGLLNFVAVVQAVHSSDPDGFSALTSIFVNLPLQLDMTKQYARPIAVTNRNGSHLIRTFAGDDTIYSGNNNGHSTVDGGLGTNTVVYSGPSSNYSITHNADGSWKVEDHVGKDGTDTLIRIQHLQFTDKVLTLSAEAEVGASIDR